jgi:hypothetical protein
MDRPAAREACRVGVGHPKKRNEIHVGHFAASHYEITLLDNDRVQADLAAHLTESYGVDACKLYWDIFEQLRGELGYADYLGALERFRLERMHDPRVLRMSSWLVDYPFADRPLYRCA